MAVCCEVSLAPGMSAFLSDSLTGPARVMEFSIPDYGGSLRSKMRARERHGGIMIEHDPKAWGEGFRAGEERNFQCPYPAGSRQAWSWHSAHIEGDGKRHGFSYSPEAAPKEPAPAGPIVASRGLCPCDPIRRRSPS